MTELADSHVALVLREVARFLHVAGGSLTAQLSTKTSTFTVTPSSPSWTWTSQIAFGGGHEVWASPAESAALRPNNTPPPMRSSHWQTKDIIEKYRGISLFINQQRWRWVQLGFDVETAMWLRLMNLRIAHERWHTQYWAELLLTEFPGEKYMGRTRIKDMPLFLEEFLRVFAGLRSEVQVVKATAARERVAIALPLDTAWTQAQEVEFAVRVIEELPQRRAVMLFEQTED